MPINDLVFEADSGLQASPESNSRRRPRDVFCFDPELEI